MLNNLTSDLDFHAKALVLRAQRQQLLASNIANADTPNFVARDFNFKQAMEQATAATGAGTVRATVAASSTVHPRHIGLDGQQTQQGHVPTASLGYAVQTQPALDNNSVDLDRERANFMDNAVRYESTLRFLNGQSKTLMSAIQGQ
jgi:flagellar basal-body rod protein FlgB